MGDIKFGISLSEYFDLKEAIQTAQAVEGLGFDSLWLAEVVYPRVVSLEPLITLGIFAAYTKTIKLGPAVVILPLRSPVGLAHAAVTLDRLSGGRFILGVGSGGESPESFQAYGVPVKERGARCDEALEIIKRLWTEHSVSFDGRFWSFSDYILGPRPLQKPHPPIWMGGARAESVLRRAARYADAFYPSRLTPSELSPMYDRIMKYGGEYGRDMSSFTKSVVLRLCMGNGVKDAQRVSQRVIEDRYKVRIKVGGASEEPAAENAYFMEFSDYEPMGPPERCIENIKEYVAAGATHIVLSMSCPADEILSQLKTFSERVMPHFK